MTEFTETAATWGRHAAVAGAVVFALGWAWVRRVAAPSRRRELAAWVVRGGLLAAVLCALPAWLLLPAPRWGTTPQAIPDRPLPPEEAQPLPVAAPPAEPQGWVVVMLPPADVVGEDALAGERRGVSPPVEDSTRPEPAGLRRAARPERPDPASAQLGVAPLVLLAYGVGVAVAALPMALGVVALVRLRRSGTAAAVGVQAVFDELAAGQRARLLVSSRVGSPLCFGLFRPVVVIPKALAAGATDAELRWVFGHELDHLRRGDPWAGWWVAAARAVYFFVPWFWRVRRQLALAQEQLADAAAVAAGGRRADYAAFLVRLSGGPAGRRHPVGAAGVRAGKSDLFWRVTMLLSANDTTPARASRRWTAAAAAGAIGTAVLLSGVGFARPSQDEKPRAAKPAPQDKPAAETPAPPGDVQVGPPPQLEALRKAVEAAAKKGENVDDIRKQLGELEKALAGKAWQRPAVAPDAPPMPPGVFAPPPGVFVPPGAFGPPPGMKVIPLPFPPAAVGDALPGFNFQLGGNPEAIKKANAALELMMKTLQDNPNDRDAVEKAMKEYQQLMLGALPNANVFGGGGAVVVGPDGQVRRLGFGDRPAERPADRPVDRGAVARHDGRLGIQVEKVPAVLVEQLGLEAGTGLVVSGVRDGTVAAKVGLKSNDIILELGGKPVSDNAAEFVRAVAAVKKGETVDLTVLRKGKKEAVKGIEFPAVPDADRPRRDGERPPAREVEALPGKVLPRRDGERPAVEGRAAFSSMSTSVTNGEFTIKAEQAGVTFTLTGSVEGGKAVPSKIAIADGDTKVDADTLEKVPAAYRDRVAVLLRSVGGGR